MRTNARCGLLSVAVCMTMMGCGDRVDRLIAQLSDPDPATRCAAARELGDHPVAEDRAVAALAISVADPDADVRRLSAQALGRIGPKAWSSLPTLSRAIDDSKPQVKITAAIAILNIDPRNDQAVSMLDAALRAADGKTMLAVGRMGSNAAWAVPTLTALLSHESAKVRALAAQTLGSIGPPAASAKAKLQHALRDANPAVQGAAQEALKRIDSPPAKPSKA